MKQQINNHPIPVSLLKDMGSLLYGVVNDANPCIPTVHVTNDKTKEYDTIELTYKSMDDRITLRVYSDKHPNAIVFVLDERVNDKWRSMSYDYRELLHLYEDKIDSHWRNQFLITYGALREALGLTTMGSAL